MNKEINMKWTSVNEKDWKMLMKEFCEWSKKQTFCSFSYTGKSSHTLYIRKLRELDQQEQFQTGSDSLGATVLRCGMRLDTQQHLNRNVSSINLCWLCWSGTGSGLSSSFRCSTVLCLVVRLNPRCQTGDMLQPHSLKEASHCCLGGKTFSWSYT